MPNSAFEDVEPLYRGDLSENSCSCSCSCTLLLYHMILVAQDVC